MGGQESAAEKGQLESLGNLHKLILGNRAHQSKHGKNNQVEKLKAMRQNIWESNSIYTEPSYVMFLQIPIQYSTNKN